jgi:uncharacterized phage infection (PIP) family protein YhgE
VSGRTAKKRNSAITSIEEVSRMCVPGMEATMAEESSMHFYLNWSKERIDEMDATLASLEANASQLQPDAKAKVERLVSDLKKRRDEFQATLKKQAEAGEAAWERAKAQLESEWNNFEVEVKAYLDSAGKQIDQQQAHLPECCRGSNEGLA